MKEFIKKFAFLGKVDEPDRDKVKNHSPEDQSRHQLVSGPIYVAELDFETIHRSEDQSEASMTGTGFEILDDRNLIDSLPKASIQRSKDDYSNCYVPSHDYEDASDALEEFLSDSNELVMGPKIDQDLKEADLDLNDLL